jgi:hypothetical protein
MGFMALALRDSERLKTCDMGAVEINGIGTAEVTLA